MSRLWLALVGCCAACQPIVNVGTDTSTFENACGLYEVTVNCPVEPWGEPRVFAQEGDLRGQLVGRWAFCGGERKYTGRGRLSSIPGGSAIEFWEDEGRLRFAYLEGPPPRARRVGVPWEGTVRLKLEGPRTLLGLVADDEQEVVWETQLFEAQPILRNSAFDVWNFVRVPLN